MACMHVYQHVHVDVDLHLHINIVCAKMQNVDQYSIHLNINPSVNRT